jgi:hypothetical protein
MRFLAVALSLVLFATPARPADDRPKPDAVRDKLRQEAERLDETFKDLEKERAEARAPKLPRYLKTTYLKPAADDDEMRKLLKERYNAAVVVMKIKYLQADAGKVPFEAVFPAAKKVLELDLELNDKPADQVAAREKMLELAKEAERVVYEQYMAGRAGLDDLAELRGFRLDAEMELLKAKKKAAAPAPAAPPAK